MGCLPVGVSWKSVISSSTKRTLKNKAEKEVSRLNLILVVTDNLLDTSEKEAVSSSFNSVFWEVTLAKYPGHCVGDSILDDSPSKSFLLMVATG